MAVETEALEIDGVGTTGSGGTTGGTARVTAFGWAGIVGTMSGCGPTVVGAAAILTEVLVNSLTASVS